MDSEKIALSFSVLPSSETLRCPWTIGPWGGWFGGRGAGARV